MKKTATADIVIFGGGIAGLWLLNRLRESGLTAILFESGSLGGGQTHKAQGIIHGGMKYALQGILTKEARMMVDMPQLWKHCLSGKGEINLSAVPVLSAQQYLWAPHKFTAKLAGFLASATLTSQVEPLPKTEYPSIFQHAAFKGEVFSLDEMVIDVPALVRELVKENQDAIFKIEPLCDKELNFDTNGNLFSATVYLSGKAIEISAQQFIFTAGAGNEMIIKRLPSPEIAMQKRPLHMVLAKMPFNHALYAHCLGMGAKPRLTITTHHMQDGSTVWYLGGELAEEGITRNAATQIEMAKSELRTLFSWLELSNVEFATFMIDRAEPQQKIGLKPDTAFTKIIQNMAIAWPTKLALAPKLAEEILNQLKHIKRSPEVDLRELRAWPMPPLARPIWEDLFCKHVA